MQGVTYSYPCTCFLIMKKLLFLCLLLIGCQQYEETPLCGVWVPLNQDYISETFSLLNVKSIEFKSSNIGYFNFKNIKEKFDYSNFDKLVISYYYLDFNTLIFKNDVFSFSINIIENDLFYIIEDNSTYIYKKIE